jgi:hypothetical protein
VTSRDGGTSWSLADSDIRAAGQNTCDFKTAPISTELYAITSAESCNTEGLPPLSLWYSSESGAHWARVGTLPSGAASGIAVVPQASGQSLLYIHMPAAFEQGHGVTVNSGPTSLHASTDGGKTWRAAPSGGIPSATPYPTLPLGVLSDGTVIEGFHGQGDGIHTPPITLFGWRYGQSAWRQVAPTLDAQILSLTIAPGARGDTFWATVNSSTSPQSSDISIESFKP